MKTNEFEQKIEENLRETLEKHQALICHMLIDGSKEQIKRAIDNAINQSINHVLAEHIKLFVGDEIKKIMQERIVPRIKNIFETPKITYGGDK